MIAAFSSRRTRACITAIAFAGCRGSASSARVEASRAPAGGMEDSASSAVLASAPDSIAVDSEDVAAYEGVDGHGIPHYATNLALSPSDADVLRRAYGIEDAHRLYVSDSSEEGVLKYDTRLKRCRTCYVNSYRIGFVSVRRPDESWEEAERRVRSTPTQAFAHGALPSSRSLDDLDPDVRPLVERMLQQARAAGFHLEITATYRSPLREAFLMAEGAGRTHTLTSNHSYGRALDLKVDDGKLSRAQTRRDWIAFRRWVMRYRSPTGESFRVLGAADHTWDWPHVEVPSSQIGFSTIEEAIARGRACLVPAAATPCNFLPHLPEHLHHPLVR